MVNSKLKRKKEKTMSDKSKNTLIYLNNLKIIFFIIGFNSFSYELIL